LRDGSFPYSAFKEQKARRVPGLDEGFAEEGTGQKGGGIIAPSGAAVRGEDELCTNNLYT
jgi:hypothetical protein